MLLIQLPPWDYRLPSSGIAYLATFLKSKGINTKVYDLNIEMYNSENVERKKGWGSNDTFWWQGNRLEQRYLSMFENFAEKILSFNTPVIGFSSVYPSIQFLNHLLIYIKRKAPDKIIIIGGPATFFPETRKEFDKSLIDYFVIGDGEIALYELLTALKNNVKFSFSKHSTIRIWKDNPFEGTICVQTPKIMDLDSIPSPTFEEFDLSLYTEGSFSLPMIFSKGCTRYCTFCSDRVLSNPYRYRKAENAVKEIMMHIKRYNNISIFRLIDLSFNANLKFLDEFCDRIIAEGLTIKWYGPAQVKSDMDERLLSKMKKAGCQLFDLGVESFSDHVLSMMKKGYTSEEAIRFIKMAKESGIENNLLLIVGYPGETEEDFNTTLESIKRNVPYIKGIGLNICGISIGSELWRYPKKHNYFFPPNSDWVTYDYSNTYKVRKRRYNEVIRLCKELNIPVEQCLDLEIFEEHTKKFPEREAKTFAEKLDNVEILTTDTWNKDKYSLGNLPQMAEGINTLKEKVKIDIIKLPTYCCIALLESCFLRCRMCYKWKDDVDLRDPKEPTLEEWKNFILVLRRLIKERFQINFAGGEPLARKETLELIKFASGLGFGTFLATNAFLIDEEIAKRIADSGLSTVNISLDSLKEERHDYIRGVKGVYRKVMRAIELLDKYASNVRIGICTVIIEENLDEIVDIIKWIQANDKIDGMGFQAVTQPFSTPEDPFWYENKEYSHLWPKDILRVDRIMNELIEMKKNGFDKLGNPLSQFYVYKAYFRDPNNFIKKVKCHIDTQAINVTPFGEIRICFYMDPIGNIKYEDINDVWFSQRAKEIRESIAACKKNCQSMVNCNFDESEVYIY